MEIYCDPELCIVTPLEYYFDDFMTILKGFHILNLFVKEIEGLRKVI